MVLLARKWEPDAGDLSWLGWAALELAPVPKCDLCHCVIEMFIACATLSLF